MESIVYRQHKIGLICLSAVWNILAIILLAFCASIVVAKEQVVKVYGTSLLAKVTVLNVSLKTMHTFIAENSVIPPGTINYLPGFILSNEISLKINNKKIVNEPIKPLPL